mmetsp:Transcript_4773/g.10015  ORF Transcript_4773/g.10015 Transcript_4773/m.10015 type:complete len:214 (-) Transcript_4773:72-713(-)
MMCVCAQAFQSVCYQLLQAQHLLCEGVCAGENTDGFAFQHQHGGVHLFRHSPRRLSRRGGNMCSQLLLVLCALLQIGDHVVRVEVDVCHCREEGEHGIAAHLVQLGLIYTAARSFDHLAQPFEVEYEEVLKGGSLGCLSAHTDSSAPFRVFCLLTLKAEHIWLGLRRKVTARLDERGGTEHAREGSSGAHRLRSSGQRAGEGGREAGKAASER